MESKPIACSCCGLIQVIKNEKPGVVYSCARCDSTLPIFDQLKAVNRTRYFALAALLMFPLAISLPAMSVEQLGHRVESSILSGILSLFENGSHVIAIIILLFSIVLPLLKLSGLFILCSKSFYLKEKHQALIYHMVEWTGRFGMLDVMLIAVLVALVKLGDLVSIESGPGAIAFAGCVVLNLCASFTFHPHIIWSKEK